MKILKSLQDKSVNFISEDKQESRFVQRNDNYFIVYLSSQNGCNKACRFCHLTQTKQTDFDQVSLQDYITQASYPLAHYKELLEKGQVPADTVNFNFMARGEAFSNDVLLKSAPQLINGLKKETEGLNLVKNFNFSTIGPTEIENIEFSDIFKDCMENVTIYYSLYSLKESFRKRWLPKALPVDLMFKKLKRWQDAGGAIALHWAFIEGQNDSEDDIDEIIDLLEQHGLKTKFNLVRYNPFSDKQGRESAGDVLEKRFNTLSNYLKNPQSRIVPRVGFDVKASCGMFVS